MVTNIQRENKKNRNDQKECQILVRNHAHRSYYLLLIKFQITFNFYGPKNILVRIATIICLCS